MSSLDPIDQIFKDSAETYQPQPGPRPWRRIERRLDRGRRTYSRPRPQLAWVRAVAAMLLIGMMAIALLQLQPKSNEVLAQQAEEVQELVPLQSLNKKANLSDYQAVAEGDQHKDFAARFVQAPSLQAAEAYRIDI